MKSSDVKFESSCHHSGSRLCDLSVPRVECVCGVREGEER